MTTLTINLGAGPVPLQLPAEFAVAAAGASAAAAAADRALTEAARTGAEAAAAVATAKTAEVVTAGNTALTNIAAARTGALGDVAVAGTSNVAAVNTAGGTQTGAVTAVGAQQVGAVNAAGAQQLLAVQAQLAAGAMSLSIATRAYNVLSDLARRIADFQRGLTPAVILAARVHKGGYEVELDILDANANGVFDPGKLILSSPDKGFNAECLPIVRWRDIPAISARRRAWPNQNQRFATSLGGITTWRAVLAEQVFAKAKPNLPGETDNSGFAPELRAEKGFFVVGGNEAPMQDKLIVTNNSQEPYDLAVARSWLPPNRLLGPVGLMETCGEDYAPQDGRVFAAVRYDMTGQTSGVTRTLIVSQMTASTAYPRRTNASPVFAAPFDTTPFTQEEDVVVRRRCYPFIGDVVTDSQTGSTYDFANETHTINHAGTYPTVRSFVNAATGSDTTGAATTGSEATAKLTPFATDRAAVRAALLLNRSAHNRNSQAGIEIIFADNQRHRLTLRGTVNGDGIANLAFFDANEIPKAGPWCVYRPEANATNCHIERNPAIALGATLPRRTVLRGFTGLDLVGSASAGLGLLNGEDNSNGTYGQELWIDNSPFIDTLGVTSAVNGIFAFNRVWMTNCNQPALGAPALTSGSARNEYMLIRDTDFVDVRAWPRVYAMGGVHAWMLAGSNAQLCEPPQNVVNLGIPAMDNIMFAGVTLRHSHGTTPFAYGRNLPINRLGALNMLVETFGGAVPPGMDTGGAANVRVKNFYHDYLTVVGGRQLIGYEDGYTMVDDGDPEQQLKKKLVFRRSVLFEIDTKVDTFPGTGGPNGLRIHTWNVANRVGWRHVRIMRPGSDGQSVPGPARWIGEAFPPSVRYIGPDARAQFENYQARHVSPNVNGAGNGVYLPAANANELLAQIPPAEEACPIDNFGTQRRGAIGAFERPL